MLSPKDGSVAGAAVAEALTRFYQIPQPDPALWAAICFAGQCASLLATGVAVQVVTLPYCDSHGVFRAEVCWHGSARRWEFLPELNYWLREGATPDMDANFPLSYSLQAHY